MKSAGEDGDRTRPGGQTAGDSIGVSRQLTVETPTPGPSMTGSPGGSLVGTTLDRFEIVERLGAGGFGEVYRARDARLRRTVAVKVLPDEFAQDADRLERFRREAIAASALNDSNICTVYDFVEAGGRHLLVMELVEGRTLHEILSRGPLAAEDAVSIAQQIASALAEAHRNGILHRDVKSGNVIVAPRGQVKVLDFGLAKRLDGPGERFGARPELTREGMALGTLTHMSPEQLLSKPLDRRADLFSLGVVMYEMATGRLPFRGSNAIAISDAILHSPPESFGAAAVPKRLETVIRRLLEKEPAKRFASAEELLAELNAIAASAASASARRRAKRLRIVAVGVGVVALAVGVWLWRRNARAAWAREKATPEIARLVEAGKYGEATGLARQARAVLPGDAMLEKLWMRATGEATVASVPSGAQVSIRRYGSDPNAWEEIGRTPLKRIRVPNEYFVWRVALPGFTPAVFIDCPPSEWTLNLRKEDGSSPGMVPVPGDETGLRHPLASAPKVRLGDFLIDQCEVTNEEFRAFVEAGGYQKREFWKQPFVKGGRNLAWEEAIALFRDATGRAGPATWEVSTYPKGQERNPVGGISWFEAAAYAEFAGKALPTVYHWTLASQSSLAALIVPGSNFRGTGTQPVGRPGTLSGFGTADMAGNVKEWCFNEGRESRRFVMGGGFGEPSYMFIQPDAQSPWERKPNYGVRCVRLSEPAPPAAAAKIEVTGRDFSVEKPVSDDVFAAFRGVYAYDRGELDARVEQRETTPDWIHEKVSFNAGYGGERVPAHLFLPRSASPPFQTVVYYPGADSMYQEKFAPAMIEDNLDFLPRSGRALLFPVYKSTFERHDDYKPNAWKPALFRDHIILWAKDIQRSLDYLQTRKDVDGSKLAYFGFSWGGNVAPVLLAVERRFRLAILTSAGYQLRFDLPEADAFNFAPRVKIPILILNGRYDDYFPLQLSQLPYFNSFGTPPVDKKLILYDAAHGDVPHKELVRESLDWLDRYFGPARR